MSLDAFYAAMEEANEPTPIQIEIDRIRADKDLIVASIENKGVNVPEGTKLGELAPLIDSIEQGGGGSAYTGSVDKVGLATLGYNAEEIAWFQAQVNWAAEWDFLYEITPENLALAGATTWAEITPSIATIVAVPKAVMLSSSTIPSNALLNAVRLRYMCVPIGVTSVSAAAFKGASRLKMVHIANTVTTLASDVLSNCYSLSRIVFDGVSDLPWRVCQGCRALSYVEVLNTINSVGGNGFQDCNALQVISFKGDVNSFSQNIFTSCQSLRLIDLSHVTKVPTLQGALAQYSAATDFEILVPSALVDEFKVATNWATYADKIISK